jgi:acyl-CoA reductase-like NAD-dependent aldehyde dehydrogenase
MSDEKQDSSGERKTSACVVPQAPPLVTSADGEKHAHLRYNRRDPSRRRRVTRAQRSPRRAWPMDLKQFVKLMDQRNFPIHWPGQWVDGRWLAARRSPQVKTSINPNNGERLVEVWADKESVNAAVEAALKARRELGSMKLGARLEMLHAVRRTLADYRKVAIDILRVESGKPAWEAESDLDAALQYLDWVARNGEDIMGKLLLPAQLGPSTGEFAMLPIGVTAAYLPFSTPLTSFAFYFAATALAGCPLVISSSSHAMLSSMLIALVTQELDLPKSALNVVFGNFSTFKQLLADKRVAAVLYTGSREHCDAIRVESRAHVGRQVVLQSGGKNAVIVHSSADLDHAVRCIVYGALKSAGQRCTSTSRVFVYRSSLPEFRERMLAALKNVPIGRTDVDGEGAGPFMGPLYSEKAVEKFLRFQTMANRESEKTLLWGRALETETKGYFVTPSLHYLSRFDNNSAYQGNVLFSPDIAVYDYDVLDVAIDQINTTDAAFAVSFLGDPSVIESRRHLFLAPNLIVNAPTVEIDATLPLAGRLQSGHHRFHGPGVALYLCYPQVVSQTPANEQLIRSWPWPRF